MSFFYRQYVPFLLICVLAISNANAQQSASLSAKAIAVKAKVESLSPQTHITVVPAQGEEEFGDLISSDPAGFTFYDIDRKSNVTFRYEEVKKVKEDYGGYNHATRRHTDHTKAIVIGVVLAGALVALIVAVAHAK